MIKGVSGAALAMALVFAGTQAMAQVSLELEGGKVYPGYNDVRIPGGSGTDISLHDEIETDPAWYYLEKGISCRCWRRR